MTAFGIGLNLKEINIVSNNIYDNTNEILQDGIEQSLTVCLDGRAYFSEYLIGVENEREKNREIPLEIGDSRAEYILKAISDYFSDDYDAIPNDNWKNWRITVTTKEEDTVYFSGSYDSEKVELHHLSHMMRSSLNMPDLLIFDGNASSDRIERIEVYYRRILEINPSAEIKAEELEYLTWEYNEHFTIDRKSEKLEHCQKLGSGCEITRIYHIEEGIVSILDELYSDDFMKNFHELPPDVIIPAGETTFYRIIVNYLYGKKQILIGSFDKYGLPNDFHRLAKALLEFISFYTMSEVLSPLVYNKAMRRQSDCIICNVQFEAFGSTYCYITEDDSLKEGDYVIVPAGANNHKAVARIDSIIYCSPQETPYPIDKIKKIIGKCDKNRDEDIKDDLSGD